MTSDEQAIANLVSAYADLVDAGDFDGIGRLFADGELHAGGASFRGQDAVTGMYRAATRIHEDTGTPKTAHHMTNLAIEVHGDTAAARTRYVVFMADDGFPLQPVIAGRYADRFVRDGAGWRFSVRRIEVDLLGDLSRHLLVDLEPSAGVTGPEPPS